MQNGFKVLMDMDGVLVDFTQGVCDALGKPNPFLSGHTNWFYHELLGVTEEEFWEPCNDSWFWEDLGWMPDGKRILQAATAAVGEANIYLSTSPTLSPGSYAGKAAWVTQHLPEGFLRRLMIGPAKYLMANPRHILVDDNDENVALFRAAGGRAILVPRPWNENRDESTVDYVQREIWRATS